MNQGTKLGSQVGRWIILAALVVALGAMLLTIRPAFAQPTPPDAPTGLTATAVGLTTIELSWTAPSNTGGARITGYVIEVLGDHDDSDTTPDTWSSVDGDGGVPNTEATGAQNEGPGVQTYYSMTATAAVMNSYRVRAMNLAGTGAASGVASDTPPVDTAQPDAPADVAATANGSSEINVTWTRVPAADAGSSPVTGYKIESSTNGSLPWTLVADVGNVDRYSHTGLAPYSTRHYRVSAVNSAGRGPHSTLPGTPALTEANAARTTPAGVPAEPTGLTAREVATGATAAIELYWTAPTNAGGAPISGYKIERSANNGKTWTEAVANTEVGATTAPNLNTNIPGIQTYYSVAGAPEGNMFRVSAINVIGIGLFSGSVSAIIPVSGSQPDAPIDLSVAAEDGLTPSSINMVWTKAANEGSSSVTQYKVEYSTNGNLPWMELATTSNTRFSHTGLTPATTRNYRVSAVSTAGRSPVSSTLTATTEAGGSPPGAPTGLTATAVGLTTIELSWTAPGSTGGAPITGYQIETATDLTAATPWSTAVANTEAAGAQNEGPGVQTYYSMTATAAIMNYYRVSAINSAGPGAASGVASMTPPVDTAQPDAPASANVVATANGSSEINLVWNKVTGGDAGSYPVTGYKIEYSSSGNLPWMLVADVGNVDRYSDTGLDPYSTRYYRVSAMNSAGRGPVSAVDASVTPDASNTDYVARTTPEGAPAEPTGLTAREVATGATAAIELYWTAPTNAGGAPISGYKIERSANNGKTWTEAVANTEVGATTAPNLNTNIPGIQTYYSVAGAPEGNMFRVSAINVVSALNVISTTPAQSGSGLFSGSVSASIPVSGSQPDAPTGVSAVADGSSRINLVWTKPSNEGDSPITEYKVEYSTNGNLPWVELATTTTATAYSHTGLDPMTTRHYRVSAINAFGRGPVSSTTETDNPHVATTDVGTGDQRGMVTLSTQAPMAGTAITATLTDEDGGVTGQMWQWEKSMNMSSWMDATGAGATSATYTPAAADEGYYLRATVEYTDAGGAGKMAESDATTAAVVLPADQQGSVSLSPQSPVAGMAVTASVTDPNGGVTNIRLQWSRSADGTAFTDIAGETSASYTTVDADGGMYLRAMATYDDSYRSNRTATSTAVMVSTDDRPQVVRDYDTDGTPGISITELFNAVDAYFAGEITEISDLFEVIDAYFENNG